jgi:hypothetical protein
MIEVELLYFDDCPSWRTAWTELGQALVGLDLDASVRLRNIEHLTPDERSGFAGSPSIRVDGDDLERYGGAPLMACRRYLENAGQGWPSQKLLRQRLTQAAGER